MSKIRLVLIFISIFSIHSLNAEEDSIKLFNDAKNAFENHADIIALEFSEQACTLGSMDGCVLVGDIHRLGRGTNQDYKKALHYYTIASNNDSVTALFQTGKLYYLGRGVEKDYKKAISYFEKAALKGDWNSQSYLGFIYSTAPSPLKNEEKASIWYLKAGENIKAKDYVVQPSVTEVPTSTKGVYKILKNEIPTSFGNIEFKYKSDAGWLMLHDDRPVLQLEERMGGDVQLFPFDKSLYEDSKKDLLLLSSGCDGTACSSKYKLYIIQKYGVNFTPTLGYGRCFSNFDGETLLIAFGDSDKSLYMYENDKLTYNGKHFPVEGDSVQYYAQTDEFKEIFGKILGEDYEGFLVSLGVDRKAHAGWTRFVDDEYDTNNDEKEYIVGEGFEPHNAQNNAIFAIETSFRTLKPYAIINNYGNFRKYGFKKWKDAPEVLRKWAKEHGANLKK
jgi:hypothetical protein